ncbi:hypothetical protein O181_030867 [Austropuccinia psidii MF-1]|uniref:sphinganine-1-phosphate aldolase n=1 Tax=Austropuccinia psidii MF-1 TaxID=1389203 RepID=A0A9Q3CWJ6_9BASI|nr:hypothetical protein [Austropuccinia psidii MF-1]
MLNAIANLIKDPYNQSIRLNSFSFSNFKNVLFWYIISSYLLKLYAHLRSRGLRNSIIETYVKVATISFKIALKFPSVNQKVNQQLDQASIDMEKKLIPRNEKIIRCLELPDNGKSLEWLKDQFSVLSDLPSADWKSGKVSGAVYHGGDELAQVMSLALNHSIISNPLHPDIFPGVRKMEAEVIKMVLNLFNAPSDAGGTTTSGGTESILMACKAYRDWAKATKGIHHPEMVVPVSAHAAFDKAAHYFGIKIHHIPVNQLTRQVNLSRLSRAINSNTIMIVGSAPNFPDGAIDDIVALGKLAKKHNIGLHVDCCLGSLLLPFIEKAGFEMVPFDFRVEGVTSISCDTHKYGFAPKGSSVIMYRHATLRQYQYSVMTSWPGGVYASPAIAGSRPGAIIAGTWAIMMYMGEKGYLESCQTIIGLAKKLERSIREDIKELEIMGKPLVSVIAFKFNKSSEDLNIYELGDYLGTKGWHLNALQKPAGLHIAITRPMINSMDDLIHDLKEGIQILKENQKNNHKTGGGDMVTLYGLGSSSAIGPGLVGDLAKRYLDVLYTA